MANQNHIDTMVISDNVVIRNNFTPDDDLPFVTMVVYVPTCQLGLEKTNLSLMMVLPHPTAN